MAVRLQRRGGSGNGAGGRDEGEGDDGWRVECEVGVGVEVEGGWADEGTAGQWSVVGRPMKLIAERRAAVSRSRGADSASIRVDCCVSVLAADATR